MPINVPGLIKLVAQIGGVVHEIGEYTAPIVSAIVRQREKGPTRPDGTEAPAADVQATLDRALASAREGKATAEAELDALDRKGS